MPLEPTNGEEQPQPMLRASNIQYEMADRTQAMNCGGRTKFSSISRANTKEVLDLVNRPGNAVSHSGCVERIERAMELVQPVAGTVTVRGDTDFTNTAELDRWDDRGWRFLLGIDAHPKLVKLADEIAANAWRPLQRLPQYEILTERRQKPHRYKEEIVVEKEFTNKVLVGEDIAEIEYQPVKCKKRYRVVIVRKNIRAPE